MSATRALVFAAVAVISTSSPVVAQIHGELSVTFDLLPDPSDAPGLQTVGELRTRLSARTADQFGEHLRLILSGHIDGLVADRGALGAPSPTTTAVIEPEQLLVVIPSSREPGVEFRSGFSQVGWGRLDEFQPTDVVNPLDLTRFLLDGRREAKLSVPLAGVYVFLPGETKIDAIVVPTFRAGRFDRLDESTSPFNLEGSPGLLVRRDEPAMTAGNLQGGARVSSTVRRLDWGASVYRGFRSFPVLAGPSAAGTYVETFPRFTMVGGDFETVHGEWGVRGEAAAFVDDALQVVSPGQVAPGLSAHDGHSIDGGVGVDRKAGDYRVAADVLWSYRAAAGLHDSEATLVASAERRFARDTRIVRVFAVYDPGDALFVRTIATFSVRDNVAFEASGGLFTGSPSVDRAIGLDAGGSLARFARRDFLYARLRISF